MKMRWDLWMRGVIAAVIGGAANGVTIVIVDPIKFNIFEGGAKNLAGVCVVFAIVSAALYLKQHPFPDTDPTK